MQKIHYIYAVGLTLIGILSVYVLIMLGLDGNLQGPPYAVLENTNMLFGLGLNSSVLIWSISIFLFYRWNKTGRNNPSLIIWSISFLLYSLTFVAHIFRALGVTDANESLSPTHFFAFRWVMVVFAAGILFGVLKIVTDNKKLQIYPSIAIIIAGLSLFAVGLFVLELGIESTMFIFLFTIWSPICFSMSYLFLYFGVKTKKAGPKIISIGFFGVFLTYLAWAPYHYVAVIYLYFIFYFLFMLSLVPILIGFIVMSYEE
ncbi:MAG: hypothetical protein GY870_22160 [archaeon]|nr:hypothetical protein [archaeon]